MDTHRIAYFAGLIDGEGYIGSYSSKRFNTTVVKIKVNMTSHETITSLKEFFGGNIHARKQVEGNKRQWEWRVSCKKAREVLRLIRPWLITKAANADEVMNIKLKYRGKAKERPA
jgi:hypothetical protein